MSTTTTQTAASSSVVVKEGTRRPSGSSVTTADPAAGKPGKIDEKPAAAPTVPASTVPAAPKIYITHPRPGAVIEAGWSLTVEATIEPRRPTVRSNLLVDGQVVATGQYPQLEWTDAGPGDHDVVITVEIEGGIYAETPPMRVHVNDPAPPPTDAPAPPPTTAAPPPPRPASPPPGTFWATVTSDVNVRYHPDVEGDVVDFFRAGTVVAVRCYVIGGPYEVGSNGFVDYFWARVITSQGENWVADGFLDTARTEWAYPAYNEC